MMLRFAALALVLLLVPGPAEAGPVAAAFSAISGAIKAFAASSVLAGAVVRIAGSLIFSALSRALAKKPKQPGLSGETTTAGGVTPACTVLGRFATPGNFAAPRLSFDAPGGSPNEFLTYVIDISDLPGVTLRRVIVDGAYVELGETPHADYGLPLQGDYNGKAWVKWYDGGQTTADAMLSARYGSDPDHPWGSDMVGRSIVYAICTFKLDKKLFQSFPEVRFEVDGIPLYDPRLDTTAGGSGAHRWNDPATWEQTDNPAVMIYNILRGIPVPGDSGWGAVRWGGTAAAEDLPFAVWAAAMNACDAPVELADEGSEPAYRAGLFIRMGDAEFGGMTPADAIDALLPAMAGQIADVGGTWLIRAGGAGLPVYSFTDDDIVISEASSFEPFPSLDQTRNAVMASYAEPEALWEAKDAPPRYDSDLEAQDGGRRLVERLSYEAVWSATQVQRLMTAWLREARRFAVHKLVLPPDAAVLTPLDTVAWTSSRYGYDGALFEVVEVAHDPSTWLQAVTLRAVDPADHDWDTSDEIEVPLPEPDITPPPSQAVPGFDAEPEAIVDAMGRSRRPGLALTWTAAAVADATQLKWEVRPAGQVVVASGVAAVADGATIVSAGIVAESDYEVRARLIAERDTEWTGWVEVTSPAVPPVQREDIAPGAVSDSYTDTLTAETSISTNDTTVVDVVLGETEPGLLFLVAFGCELISSGGIGHTSNLRLDWRVKDNGTWGSWTTAATLTGATSYRRRSAGFFTASGAEDIEVRVRTVLAGGGQVTVRNAVLTAAALIPAA